jgi:hypothetical protein
VTHSRRRLFALLGLVLPVAAFTAIPADAAVTGKVSHQSSKHHVNASHTAKKKKPHGQVHQAAHRPRHTTKKVSES